MSHDLPATMSGRDVSPVVSSIEGPRRPPVAVNRWKPTGHVEHLAKPLEWGGNINRGDEFEIAGEHYRVHDLMRRQVMLRILDNPNAPQGMEEIDAEIRRLPLGATVCIHGGYFRCCQAGRKSGVANCKVMGRGSDRLRPSWAGQDGAGVHAVRGIRERSNSIPSR